MKCENPPKNEFWLTGESTHSSLIWNLCIFYSIIVFCFLAFVVEKLHNFVRIQNFPVKILQFFKISKTSFTPLVQFFTQHIKLNFFHSYVYPPPRILFFIITHLLKREKMKTSLSLLLSLLPLASYIMIFFKHGTPEEKNSRVDGKNLRVAKKWKKKLKEIFCVLMKTKKTKEKFVKMRENSYTRRWKFYVLFSSRILNIFFHRGTWKSALMLKHLHCMCEC